MYLEIIKNSFYRRVLITKLYRNLLKETIVLPDPFLKAFYKKLIKSEFGKKKNVKKYELIEENFLVGRALLNLLRETNSNVAFFEDSSEKIIRIAYNQSSLKLQRDDELSYLNEKNSEKSKIIMKVEKTKEFIQKDEQTKNFILFVLKKTMFKNIKSSKLDYLSDKKITNSEGEIIREIPNELKENIVKNFKDFGKLQKIYLKVFKKLELSHNKNNILKKKFVFDIIWLEKI